MAGSVDETQEWLRRARDALGAGSLLLDRGYFLVSVSRAYYAMFYAAKAAVVSEGLEAIKHSTVISVFGQHFAKTGRVPGSLHKSLRIAFDERQLADYTLDWTVSREAAQTRLAEAEHFVSAISALLVSPP